MTDRGSPHEPTPRLLPCPFCGGDDIGNRYIETYSCDSSYDIFGCKACGAGFDNDDQSGPSLWNRRAAAPAVQGEPESSGLYAVYLRDNWDGEGDTYWILARKQDNGVWVSEDSGKELIEHEGDALMKVVPLVAASQPAEQQPVAEVKYGGYASGNELVWAKGAGLQFLPEGTKLYAASIHAPTPVAYLDVGAGGYMDLGTDLTEDQVGSLPWGRHILAIVGTYGADGYVPAEHQRAPDVAGLVEALEAIVSHHDEYFRDSSEESKMPWIEQAHAALAPYRKGSDA